MREVLLGRSSFLKLMGALVGAVCAGNLIACSEDSGSEPSSTTLFFFDTQCTITAYCSEEILEKASERCRFFEQTFSRTVEGSDVWQINHAQGEMVDVERETYDVIAKALEYAKVSGGSFDITIGAVSELWDFDAGIRPSSESIAQALPHVSYKNLILDEANCRVGLSDPLSRIDLGGIAKGYIADDLTELFKGEGCKSALINLGGNVMCVGTKPDGSPWKVGIQDPNASTGSSIIASVECSDTTVVTSGLYERHFEEGGVDYYHILDPKTGYPVLTDLVSSSIVSASSTEADAWATILFMQGTSEALTTLDSREDFDALLVNDAGEILVSDGTVFNLV